MSRTHVRTVRSARAFSLIELLVVLVIIALVIGILLPALRGARQTSRAAATQALMKDLATASQSFKLSSRRDPGYFSPVQMGSSDNLDRGLSSMQNVLIDLAGGLTTATTGNILQNIGPTGTGSEQINIDLGLIGSTRGDQSGPGGYFAPDKRYFVAQNADNLSRASSIAGHRDLPELIDAFGQPILAWTMDERRADKFVSITSDGGSNNEPAKFYWAQNAALLRSGALGKERQSQVYVGMGVGERGSLIGASGSPGTLGGNSPDTTCVPSNGLNGSLATLLANPAFTRQVSNTVYPSQPRGTQIFQSAGRDGTYLSNNDAGAKRWAAGPGGATNTAGIQFGPIQPQGGQNIVIDAITDFDDIVTPVNN
jgi:prepilin-type N-terminal cleavage/methylation domain-containing protein